MQHVLGSRRHFQDFSFAGLDKLLFNLEYPFALENGVILPRFLVKMQTVRMAIRVDALLGGKAQIGQTHMVRMKTGLSNSKQPAVVIPWFREWDSTSPVKSQLSPGFIYGRRKL
jgi:hypothetical protein